MIYNVDATNSTTTGTETDAQAVMTWPVVEDLVDWDDVEEGEAPYQTFIDGWRFRFDHWHMHPWYGEQLTSLVPVADRSRRFEETGRSRRWTSGFK